MLMSASSPTQHGTGRRQAEAPRVEITEPVKEWHLHSSACVWKDKAISNGEKWAGEGGSWGSRQMVLGDVEGKL